MKKINKKTGGSILLVAILIVMLLGISNFVYEKIMLLRPDYTIGTTISTSPRTGKPIFTYKYIVNGKEYFGADDFYSHIVVPGGKYKVRYSILNPRISEILVDSVLNDSSK